MANKIGYIYIMRSPVEGLYKIGFTSRDVNSRAKELSSQTGVIGKFSLERYFEVPAFLMEEVEATSHRILKRNNKHHSKEYFNASLSECLLAVEEAIRLTDSIKHLNVIKLQIQKDNADFEVNYLKKKEEESIKHKAICNSFLQESQQLRMEILDIYNKAHSVKDEISNFGFFSGIFSRKTELNNLYLEKDKLLARLNPLLIKYDSQKRQFMKQFKLTGKKFGMLSIKEDKEIYSISCKFRKTFGYYK